MSNSAVISENLVVGFNYTLTLDSGEVIDQSEPDLPLYYLHGHENIIPGLEKQLIGLKVGATRKVTVSPNEAYGDYDEDGFHAMRRELFPEGFVLEVGMLLHLNDDESNEEMEAFVHEITDDEVILDTNHPLAGETLTFDVEIVDIRPATAEEIEYGHANLDEHGQD
ncbi:MAG: peptidylprolyl isomerase [Chloroflexota bacterium]